MIGAACGEHAAHTMADGDFGAGDLGGDGAPRIWRTLSCNAYIPYMPECMYDRLPPLVLAAVSGPPWAVLRSAMKAPASPRGTKPKSSRP